MGEGVNIFKVDKILDRMDQMIDNAIEGKNTETQFDETKMSALETKLHRYLIMTETSNRKLNDEKEKINEMISDISHQTKTPIANILLYSQLLEESNLPEIESEYVRALVVQAEKLSFLIDALVKASRLETGIISVLPKLQPIAPMLKNLLEKIMPKAQSKNIYVSVEDTDLQGIFDLKWTEEAIYNILDNAVKYTPIGGAVSIKATAYQFFCRIDIEDNGIGIYEDEITKIFARFYRSANVSDLDGVGIGLYLAREIISAEKGYIKVSSKIGKGSVFSVFLPMNQ